MKRPIQESNVDYNYRIHKYMDWIENQNKELIDRIKHIESEIEKMHEYIQNNS